MPDDDDDDDEEKRIEIFTRAYTTKEYIKHFDSSLSKVGTTILPSAIAVDCVPVDANLFLLGVCSSNNTQIKFFVCKAPNLSDVHLTEASGRKKKLSKSAFT